MKVLMVMVLFIVTNVAYGQEIQQWLLVEEIITECRATIETEEVAEILGLQRLVADVPKYFDEDRIKRAVKSVVDKYSNVSVVQAWRRDWAGDIEATIIVTDKFVQIDYSKKYNQMTLTWKVDTD